MELRGIVRAALLIAAAGTHYQEGIFMDAGELRGVVRSGLSRRSCAAAAVLAALIFGGCGCGGGSEAAFTLAESKRFLTDRGVVLNYMDCILVKNAPKDRAELKRLMIYHALNTSSAIDTLQAHPELNSAICCFIKSTPKTRKFFIERKGYVYGEFLDEETVNPQTYIGSVNILPCEYDHAKTFIELWLPVEGKYGGLCDLPDEDAHVLSNECKPGWYEANKNDDLAMYFAHCAKKAGKNAPPPAVIDADRFADARDGKSYKSVKIGNQTWMAENLNYKAASSDCYGGKDANCGEYGGLYDWNTASSACPEGWRLPSGAEWDTLVAAAGGDTAAGKRLKAASGWHGRPGKSGGGTDDYGFSALPGGSRYGGGDVFTAGYHGQWWTSAEYGGGYAYYRAMTANGGRVREYGCAKGCGLSVRCIRDY